MMPTVLPTRAPMAREGMKMPAGTCHGEQDETHKRGKGTEHEKEKEGEGRNHAGSITFMPYVKMAMTNLSKAPNKRSM